MYKISGSKERQQDGEKRRQMIMRLGTLQRLSRDKLALYI